MSITPASRKAGGAQICLLTGIEITLGQMQNYANSSKLALKLGSIGSDTRKAERKRISPAEHQSASCSLLYMLRHLLHGQLS